MSRQVDREAFGYCAETCPQVDGAFADAWDDLKPMIATMLQDEAERVFDRLLAKVKEVGTEKLRDALRQAVGDKQDAEGERDDLKREVDRLQREADDLRDDLRSVERELAEVSA